MPKYKNKYTGDIIDIPCTLNDEAWEALTPAPKVKEEKKDKPVKKIIKKTK